MKKDLAYLKNEKLKGKNSKEESKIVNLILRENFRNVGIL